jgi:hypothetical protein
MVLIPISSTCIGLAPPELPGFTEAIGLND